MKNDDSSLSMTPSLRIKNLKIDKFNDFCSISIIPVGQTYLEMLFPL